MDIKTTWTEVEVLPVPFQEYVRSLYRPPIRVDVRIALSTWLDQLNWDELNSGSVGGSGLTPLTPEFLRYLRAAASNATEETVRRSLAEALSATRTTQPTGLVVALLANYRHEREIIKQYVKLLRTRCESKIILIAGISIGLRELQRNRVALDVDLSKMESAMAASREGQNHEEPRYQQLLKRIASAVSAEEIERFERELVRLWNVAWAESNDSSSVPLLARLQNNITTLEAMRELIVDANLKKFWRNQRFADYSEPVRPAGLDRLQAMCECLVETTLSHVELIHRLNALFRIAPIQLRDSMLKSFGFLSTQMKTLMVDLITGCFVIEQQPLQIIRTFTRIETEVRLLLGDRIDFRENPPVVTVHFVRAPEANDMARGLDMEVPMSGRTQNNVAHLRYDPQRRALLATFDSLCVTTVGRSEDVNETDPEEKFWLLFETVIQVEDLQLRFQTISRPIVVIGDDDQLPLAQATVLWSNAFCKFEKTPFVAPTAVCWHKMAGALSARFHLVTGTHLSGDDLHFLEIKALRDPHVDFGDGARELTWKQFAKEPLPGTHFTFWEWCLALLSLCRDILGDLWRDRIVWGFIPYDVAERWLMKASIGTFILKFSEKALGALSVVWVTDASGRKEVKMLEPFAAGDFSVRDLIEKIHESEQLLYLYPTTPKGEAFRKYTLGPNARRPEYVNSRATAEQPQNPGAGSAQSSKSETELDVIGL